MAWLQCFASGNYHIGFCFGGQTFKRSLRTKSESEAMARQARLEENIRLVEGRRIELNGTADIPTFLLSDGKLPNKITLSTPQSLKALLEDLPPFRRTAWRTALSQE